MPNYIMLVDGTGFVASLYPDGTVEIAPHLETAEPIEVARAILEAVNAMGMYETD